ncbi:phage tail spike protein [Clostridium perfringens]|nr:phage tail spike protein [Clostridium perfringens]
MELLQLYDKNKNKKAGLTEYKDLCIESVLTTGDKKLSFSYSKEAKYYDEIVEEGYIRTKKDEFVIKARDVGVDYTRFDCVLNLETLEANIFDRFESVEQTITNALNLAIVGTGWTVKDNTLKKKRTVRCTNKNALEIVQEIKKTYRVDIVFNTLEKQIEIYEHLGKDKGTYFIDSLNLTALQVQSDSYKFATRIIAEGKDGLTFSSINNGKNYVENYQYSKKVKTLYWKDERYTIKESLLEDAKAKLEEISKPFVSYNASILNLAELNPKYKSILDYSLGDTITLISRNNKVKDKQRIVKILEYPQDHSRDTVELANAVLKFEDIQQENQETTDTVNNITTDNGTIDGSTIDGIKVKQIEDFKANVVEVVNLKAINANIDNLHANKADIQDLHAVTAKIGTLEATKANITQLNAVNAEISKLNSIKANIVDLNSATAKIGVLESKTASIDNLLAGNLTADNFKANAITAGSAVIAEGAIGSSQISSLSVNKLEAGDITTSKHRIVSADGTIEIVGNQILINRNNINRVILGEYRKSDGTTEYGLLVRAKDGQTIMLDGNGVHNAGITDGAIDNNKVADNANISGNKLDINSVIREVNNNGTETIKGTKVAVGDRTLDVELSTQKNTITEHSKELSSQKASLTALDNALKFKVDSQTFTQSTTTINNNINKAKEEAINSANSNTTNAINNIQIGGVNLLISNLAKTYPNNVGLGTENKRNDESISYVRILSDSKKHISVFGATIGEILKDKFILNQKYTISCEVRIPTEGYVGFYAGTPVNHVLANKWTKISYTFVGTSNNVRVVGFEYSGTQLDYRNLKLEEGEFATDYSLPTEDVKKYSDEVAKAKANNALNSAKAFVNTEINTVNTHLNKNTSEINILKEKIESKVSQTDIDKTIKTIDDKIKSTTEKITTVESTLTQKTNSIEAGVRDLNSTTQSITTNVSNINRDLTSKINSNLDVAKNFATDIATNKANTAKQEAISSANNIASSKANEALNNAKAYTNAEITTINSKVHNVESGINILKDQIKSKVSQSDIDKSITNIQIGGKNLLPFTKDFKSRWNLNCGGLTDGLDGCKAIINKRTEVPSKSIRQQVVVTNIGGMASGDTVTISGYYYIDSSVNMPNDNGNEISIRVYYNGKNSFYDILNTKFNSSAKGKWIYFNTTSLLRKDVEISQVDLLFSLSKTGFIKLTKVKLEKGNKATDWTPAPEDFNVLVADNIKIVDTKISDVSSTVTQLKNSVTTEINSINSKTTTLNGKIVNAETRLNSVEAKITDTSIINTVRREFYSKGETDNMYSSKTEVTQLSNSLEWKISTLGAGNLIKNSSFEGGFDCWEKFRNPTLSTNTEFLKDSYGKMISIEGDGGIFQRFPTIPGEKYTVSFYAEADRLKPLATTIGIEGINLITLVYEPNFKRWSFTFTATSKEHTFIAYLGQYGKFYLGRVMVTQGSILQEYREGLGIYSNVAKFDTNGFTVESSSTNTRTITDSAGFRVQDKRTGENLLEANTKGVSARGGRFYVDGPNGNYTLMWGRDIVINGQRAIVGTHSHPEASLKANKMYLNYNNDFRNGVEIAGELTNNTFPIPSLIGAIKGENGFRKLSDGFMIVWGKAVMPIKEGKVIEGTIPFHTAFPNACFLFNAKLAKVDGNDYWAGNYTLNSYPLDKFGGRVYGLNMQKYISTQGAWVDVYYFAIGC